MHLKQGQEFKQSRNEEAGMQIRYIKEIRVDLLLGPAEETPSGSSTCLGMAPIFSLIHTNGTCSF